MSGISKRERKRDAVLSLLEPGRMPDYTPAAFFLHFGPAYHRGQAAVDKHLEYFRYTGMDLVKIQYEETFPPLPEIRRPEDWARMPCYGLEFYAAPLHLVEGLVKAAKAEALVIQTLYSPFMCAGHTVGAQVLAEHMKQDPEKVKRGMQAITDSLMLFVKECVRLGLDGFYTSTQGGESGRFDGPALFEACIRPYDLALMEEINRACIFNILHVCDYHLPYRDLAPFVNYPGHVVNVSLELTGGKISAREVASRFERPYMGGLERKGVIATGSLREVQAAAEEVLRTAPERFILGADCTVPGETSWDNLKTAIATAHAFRR
jgi:uroporphyrinogen decarboxylase